MRLVFDLESNGLLKEVTQLHCICAQDLDTGSKYSWKPWELEEALDTLKQARELIGHNIQGYDLRVLKKLYGFTFKGKVTDTLILSKLAFGDGNDSLLKRIDFGLFKQGKIPGQLIGSHKLEAFGYRVGLNKGEFGKQDNAWELWTPEMQEYCELDVEVTVRLYERLMNKYLKDVPEGPRVLEHASAYILDVEQHDFGFTFNRSEAEDLKEFCEIKKTECLQVLKAWSPDKYVPVYKKGQMIIKEPKRRSNLKAGDIKHGTEPGANYCEVKLRTFTGTDADIIALLTEKYGWKPEVLTESGQPSTKAEHIDHLEYDCMPYIMDLKVVNKVLGYVDTGKNAWLKLVEDDDTIRHRCFHIGTTTHRGAHSSPNLGQIPASRGSDLKKDLGKRCRKLFGPPKGYYQIGSDLSGIEVRLLAHYLAPYDGGKYINAVLAGDIHWQNVLLLGIFPEGTKRDKKNPTHVDARDDIAKTYLYAMVYGAGSEKLKAILKVDTLSKAKSMTQTFEQKIGLGALKDAIQKKCKDHGKFKGLDGRVIYCDTQHKALNYLLQSAGGIIAKKWMVIANQRIREAGYTIDQVCQMAWVHKHCAFRSQGLSNNQVNSEEAK